MIRFVIRQLAFGVLLIFISTAVTFALVYSNTAGIARQILGTHAAASDVAALSSKLGLSEPLPLQYIDWVGAAFTGNLGTSYYGGEEVTAMLAARIPVTLSLVLISVLLMVVLSAIIGVTAATRGGWVDRLLQILAVVGGTIPNFIIAIALVFAFAVAIRLVPATGYISPDQSVVGWASTLVLPVIAVLITSVAGAAQQFRGSMIDALSQDFIRTLRTRGVSSRAIVYRHALRNAAIPGLTTISLQTIGLIGGVVVIEQIFNLPGIAAQLSLSTTQRDIPVVMGCVLFTILVVIVVNIVIGVLTGWLNPKARVR